MQYESISWQRAWEFPTFRIKLIAGLIILAGILFFAPEFFLYIQLRDGLNLDDKVLEFLPATDVSVFIFLLLYPFTALVIWRMVEKTAFCITALWSYILLCMGRIVTIYLVPLDPPAGLIDLKDPFSVFFYGTEIVTKDLFFSGHTATLFLIALCLERKWEKRMAFAATLILAILLMVQRVHYTADIIAAPFFSYLFWYLAKQVSNVQR
jgi:hypothetical protein